MQIEAKILSDITVFMKYAKFNPTLNRRENWKELVDRNKQMHLEKYPNLKEEIEAAYRYVYDKKILPSMLTYRDWETDRKSTRLNSSHSAKSRMPSSA